MTYCAELTEDGAILLSQTFESDSVALDVPGLTAEQRHVTLTITTQRGGIQALVVYRCSFDWTPPEPIPAVEVEGET
ncbi:hypothetical protein FQZ97_1253840 [compost metagenome]